VRFEIVAELPPSAMKPKASFRLTATNRAVIIEYSQLIGCRPAEFLNRFLGDYLVQQFNHLRNGTREEFLCTFEFRERSVAERLAAWLKEGHTQIKCQWELETEVLASTEGTYRVAAAKTRGGQMYRIG